MTQLLTFKAAANIDNDFGVISVTETTANAWLVYNSDGVADGYNDVAVARILKAKNAKTNVAFTNGDEFLDWLHK